MKLLSLIAGVALVLAADSRLGAEPTRIALVSDTHVNRGTAEDQPLYRGRLEKVIAAVNAEKVDFVLIAGDLTQNGKPDEIADFKTQVRGFTAPAYWVPGNHDVGNKRLPNGTGGPENEKIELIERELGPSYWARDLGELRVIGVNSQIFGSGLAREPEAWTWLEHELAASSMRPKIVVMHMPPFVKTADEPGGVSWNFEPEPRARVLALLHRYGVRTVLTGHLHRQLVNHDKEILIVTTPPVSFGLPRATAPQGWTLVTIPKEGEAQYEFRSVRDAEPGR